MSNHFEEILRLAITNYKANVTFIILIIMIYLILFFSHTLRYSITNYNKQSPFKFPEGSSLEMVIKTLIVLYLQTYIILYYLGVKFKPVLLLRWIKSPSMQLIKKNLELDHALKMLIYQIVLLTSLRIYDSTMHKTYMPILDLCVYSFAIGLVLLMCRFSISLDLRLALFYTPLIVSLTILIIDRLVVFIYKRKSVISNHKNNIDKAKDTSFFAVCSSKKMYNLRMNTNIVLVVTMTMYLTYMIYNIHTK